MDRATSDDELDAFEAATRDLAGLALGSMADVDVSLPQFRLLLVLSEQGRSSSTSCADALGVAGSSVTRLADRLHASGHLVRGTGDANRSVVTLELTDAGQRVVDRVTTHRRSALRRALDQLDPEERRVCAGVLDKLHGLWGPAAGHGSGDRLPL